MHMTHTLDPKRKYTHLYDDHYMLYFNYLNIIITKTL